MDAGQNSRLIELTGRIVAAYVSRNAIQPSDLPVLINTVVQSLQTLSQPQKLADAPAELKPAVPVKKSIQPDYIICLEDGKKLKMMKRYLRSTYGLSPDAYRAKWGLPADYPMVAPNYAKARSDMAFKFGLGRLRAA